MNCFKINIKYDTEQKRVKDGSVHEGKTFIKVSILKAEALSDGGSKHL